MPARRALSDEQVKYVKRVAAIKRRLVDRLRKLPTNAEMARQMNCSPRVIDKYSTCAQTEVSRESDSQQYRVHVTDAEFAQLMRTE